MARTSSGYKVSSTFLGISSTEFLFAEGLDISQTQGVCFFQSLVEGCAGESGAAHADFPAEQRVGGGAHGGPGLPAFGIDTADGRRRGVAMVGDVEAAGARSGRSRPGAWGIANGPVERPVARNPMVRRAPILRISLYLACKRLPAMGRRRRNLIHRQRRIVGMFGQRMHGNGHVGKERKRCKGVVELSAVLAVPDAPVCPAAGNPPQPPHDACLGKLFGATGFLLEQLVGGLAGGSFSTSICTRKSIDARFPCSRQSAEARDQQRLRDQ